MGPMSILNQDLTTLALRYLGVGSLLVEVRRQDMEQGKGELCTFLPSKYTTCYLIIDGLLGRRQ